MSSMSIILQKHEIMFSVDTAVCRGTIEKRFRDRVEKSQKVFSYGKDMAFISGMLESTEKARIKLHEYVGKNNHLNIELVKQYLQKEFPYSQCKYKDFKLHDIGVTILSIVNNEAMLIDFNQTENFKPNIKTIKKEGDVDFYVTGVENEKIHKYGHNYFKNSRNYAFRDPDSLITIYQNNYSESVGGYIQVYKMNCDGCTMIQETQLKEEGLCYVETDERTGCKYYLSDNNEQNFIAHIQGGSFIGGAIWSNNYDSGSSGMKINMENGTIDSPNFQVSSDGTITAQNASLSGVFTSSDPQWGRMEINGAYLQAWDKNGVNKLNISSDGHVVCHAVETDVMNCKSGNVNDYQILTEYDRINNQFPPQWHTQNSLSIVPDLTTSKNINLLGAENAASVTYVQETFVRKDASDTRLKYDMKRLDIPDDLFLELKAYSYRFKTDDTDDTIHWGLLAQQVKALFDKYGLNAEDYNLIEYVDVKPYTNEGAYVKDKVLRLNYNNLIVLLLDKVQTLYSRIGEMESKVLEHDKMIADLYSKVNA